MGANTAIFQLIDAVRMRTLPVKNPQELAVIHPNVDARAGRIHGYVPSVTNRMWEQIRKRQQGFTGVFAFGCEDFNLATGGQVRYAQGMWVSGEFFDVLGIQPILGRVFHAADDHAGCGMPGARSCKSTQPQQRSTGFQRRAINISISINYDPTISTDGPLAGQECRAHGVAPGATFSSALRLLWTCPSLSPALRKATKKGTGLVN